MNKRQILISCFVIMNLAACKKNDSLPDTPPDTIINPVGVWSLVSSNRQQNNNPAPTYTSNDYPCLSNNKLYINSDGTAKGKYVGTDTCYLYQTSQASYAIGASGDSTNGTWSQSGNTVFLKFNNIISYANLSTVNGISQIIERDTISSMNMIITSIYEK